MCNCGGGSRTRTTRSVKPKNAPKKVNNFQLPLKKEAPKVVQPKVDAPKVVQPKVDAPKVAKVESMARCLLK